MGISSKCSVRGNLADLVLIQHFPY
ncbi:hypothetical protein MTR67_005462 [Solanum verrucosum]|uniref:Uncharacterized protein n=1 Tax=Solanum verrucosum TaxID=315347 RepID=A0AAF0PWC8_SOLVR|nr:hypothetical protein MTR67_005462 [Solanum verrucosum]